MTHPTQIFLSNPQGLRVEYRIDDAQLEIWWSPLAGKSTDFLDRNYSSRDNHLNVFKSIHLPDCSLDRFTSCEYDPYHTILHFKDQSLHIAIHPKQAVVMVWADSVLVIEIESGRFDTPLQRDQNLFRIERVEPRYRFEFAAAQGPGAGTFRHCPIVEQENCLFTQTTLTPGQHLSIGVGLAGEGLCDSLISLCSHPITVHLANCQSLLSTHEEMGATKSSRYPKMDALRS